MYTIFVILTRHGEAEEEALTIDDAPTEDDSDEELEVARQTSEVCYLAADAQYITLAIDVKTDKLYKIFLGVITYSFDHEKRGDRKIYSALIWRLLLRQLHESLNMQLLGLPALLQRVATSIERITSVLRVARRCWASKQSCTLSETDRENELPQQIKAE